MKKTKRILALAGVILLVGMYLLTLILAIMQNEFAQALFRASFACTFIIPVLLYAYMLFYRVNHKDQDEDLEDKN